MTSVEKCIFCRNQFLYDAFLSDYSTELHSLYKEPLFMAEIERIHSATTESIEFSSDIFSPEFKRFKDSLCDHFFQENLWGRFPAYGHIYDAIKSSGHAGKSAAISTYFALRFLTLSTQEKEVSAPPPSPVPLSHWSEIDVREKWPAQHRCDDGHKVRSKSEQLVDNWLYNHGICHAYEKILIDCENRREYISDFYLPAYDLYIEIWGLTSPEYKRHMAKKISVYEKNGFKLLSVNDDDIRVLDDTLSRNLL